ncbi:MAG TPA: glucosyl-3-phosphoglycerate synthase [Solirubrobacterales bacterium]|jgi:glucosyl-3-phosphoglycerate synthase
MMLATFDHTQFKTEDLLRRKRESVTVCIPTKEAAATIAATVRAVGRLRELGLVDQLLVIDADSPDGTATLAVEAGAEVHREADLLPAAGPVEGKGDAMWRGLSVATGDLVVFLDGDVHDFGAHYVTGLLGPLLGTSRTDFVRGFYRRPLAIAETGLEIEDGGGRVTELTARPLLELLVPELADFRQPLAGECAARRELLTAIPFTTGYGVEIAMLVDVWRRTGIERMAQVDLGTKRNSHQSLAALAAMARDVLAALAAELDGAAPSVPDEPGTDDKHGSMRAAPGVHRRLRRRPPLTELSIPAAAASSCTR